MSELDKRAEAEFGCKYCKGYYCADCGHSYKSAKEAGAQEVLRMAEEWIPQEREDLKYDIEDYPAAENLLRYLKAKLEGK